jgi:type II secretory pathway component GspD/PulD (secretin)
MSLRFALAILAAGLGLATASAQQPAKPEATVYRLRNTAAADVVDAVNKFAAESKIAVTIVAEPISNSVFIAGEPAPQKKALELVTAIDKAPPIVRMQMMILEVPAGFAEEIGLGEGDNWVLTPREVRMLSAAVRREKKDGRIDILSQPQLAVADNQRGFVQVGSGTPSMIGRITPRVTPDSKSVMLRLELEFSKSAGTGVSNAQNITTTEMVPNGGALVLRGASSKTPDGGTRALYFVTTVEPIFPR